jgi:hypothetical protein
LLNSFAENNINRGNSRKNKIIQSEEDERMIDFVEDDKNPYVFSSFLVIERNVRVVGEDNEIEVIARRKVGESVPSLFS